MLLAGALCYLVISAYPAAVKADTYTTDGYETNVFAPAFDIWANITDSSSPLALNSVGDGTTSQGWQLVHYMLFTDAFTIDDLIVTDPNVKFMFNLFGTTKEYKMDHANDLNVLGGDEKTEAGLTDYSETGRAVNTMTEQTDQATVTTQKGDDINNVYPMTYNYFNGTASTYDSIDQNYTIPDLPWNGGFVYEATDGKSLNDYGDDIAEGESEQLYSILNASMVGFEFDDYADHDTLTWYFDDVQTVSTGSLAANNLNLDAFSLKRALPFLKSKKIQTSGSTAKKILDLNIFKPRKFLNIPGMPSGALKGFSALIPSFSFGSRTGTKSIFGNLFKGGKGAIIAVVAIALIGYVIYSRGKKGGR